ncbi:MAG TPA: hypothetical protein VGK48_09610 [Terriglobia bacterium]|jgi:hypothetical protein
MEQNHEKPKISKIPYIGGEPVPGTCLETVYKRARAETLFAMFRNGTVQYVPSFASRDTEVLTPYPPTNNLIRNRVILFPSAADEYDTKEALVAEIRSYLHRYVTISPVFENIAAYYILLTWIYDGFATLPYLRARGDFGSGKTRFLTVVGSLCFRAIFAGATTASPLFRMLDSFRGTLVIDEGDFRYSDEQSDIAKILNNGNSKGFPVLRSEQAGNGKVFNPVAYTVFGPKVIATRGFYDDPALESRFISEDMGRNRPRADMPLHLPESFQEEAEKLRNKLLMFRFRNLHQYSVTENIEGLLEPRISQIFAPLLSVVGDDERDEILGLIREYSAELSLDRSGNIEQYVVEAIKELWTGEALPLKAITMKLNEKYRDDFQELASSRRVGFVVRRQLNIRTRRRGGVFEILPSEDGRIQALFGRFGVMTEEQAG